MGDKVIVTASIVWLSICFVCNLLVAGMYIASWSTWNLVAYKTSSLVIVKIADAIAGGCIIYTLWTCCK